MGLKVFYDVMSQPCRAILIFLKVNKIPFESKVIALRKGEHLTEAFKTINPLQRVPVIDHNGFVLTESISIIRYLSKEYKILDIWYPRDNKRQARVDEYLEWQHLNTRLFGSMIFRERVITPTLTQKPPNEEKIAFYKNGFQKVLKEIEVCFLKDKSYLCNDGISVADIFAACEIEQALAVGFDPFSETPLLKTWLDRIRRDLDPYYSEVHGILKNLESKVLSGKL